METTITYPDLMPKQLFYEKYFYGSFIDRKNWPIYVEAFDLQEGQIWIGEKRALRILKVDEARDNIDVIQEDPATGELTPRQMTKAHAVASLYIFNMTPHFNHPELCTFIQAMPF